MKSKLVIDWTDPFLVSGACLSGALVFSSQAKVSCCVQSPSFTYVYGNSSSFEFWAEQKAPQGPS